MVRMEGNDLDLVQQTRAGDPDAFREIVERHSRRLFRTAYRLTGNEAHADDVVQENFLRAYRNLQRFDARSQLGSWLYRITVNCAMDLMRKETRRTARETSEGKVELATLETPEPRPIDWWQAASWDGPWPGCSQTSVPRSARHLCCDISRATPRSRSVGCWG